MNSDGEDSYLEDLDSEDSDSDSDLDSDRENSTTSLTHMEILVYRNVFSSFGAILDLYASQSTFGNKMMNADWLVKSG